MPKLLQINVCYGYYSTGKIAESISDIVKKHGWESYAAYRCDVPSKNTASLIPVGHKYSRYSHYIISQLFDGHGLGSTWSTKRLIKSIESIKPDIIHIHNIHGYYLNYRLLFNYLAIKKLPVVITTHDCWLFTGHCSHFTKISCDKWQKECHECKLRHSYPASIFDRSKRNYLLKKRLFEKLSNVHIATVSQWLADIVSKSFLQNRPIHVIHNGIDINKFRILQNSEPVVRLNKNEKLVLGVSSAWYEDKGISDYIHLSKILPSNIKICLVGVNKKIKRKLPSSIISLEKTQNVDDLVRIYNQASVVLSLSKSETFGLTIVEGYSCGTPAIVYDNTALPELISNATGKVVPTGDIEKVKDAILEIVAKGKECYSIACRSLAVDEYDNNKCFENYYNLYNKILFKS